MTALAERLHRRVQRYGWDLAVDDYDQGWVPLLRDEAIACVERAAIRPGDRVLDVSAGTGTATFLAAARCLPGGRVHGVDLSQKMVAAAAARAPAHVTFGRADMETTGVPDGSYDVALNVYGLMYAANRRAAVAELHRVLAPRGRVAVAVWGRRDLCGWREIFPIIDARVSSDVCPLFYAFGVPGALAAALTEVGFVDVREERRERILHWSSADAAVGALLRGGPVALAYNKLAPDARAEVDAEMLASLEPHRTPDGAYDVPAEMVVAAARRA